MGIFPKYQLGKRIQSSDQMQVFKKNVLFLKLQKYLRKIQVSGLLVLLIISAGTTVFGQSIYVGPDKEFKPKILNIPYGFYNEHFGAAVGYVYGIVGYPQKQSALLATVMAGTEGSVMGFLIGRDIRIPFSERLFVDPIAQVGSFRNVESYIDGNPEFAGERAGTNDSHEDNFVEGDGWDNFFRIRFKYLLPIGHGADEIVNIVEVERGLRKSDEPEETSRNPLVSGRTYLELTPFYRWQEINGDYLDTDKKTNGLMYSLFLDNRDFMASPSKGSSLSLKLTQDYGWLDSSDSWTAVSAEFDKYFSLGESDRFRQRVIAFNFWTADTPSWETKITARGEEISHRAPPFAGATLGGVWRMRAYPSQRFNDRAAIYYAAELRVIPRWNPFDGWPWLQKYLEVAWWQWVPFVEIGRVASSWSLDELHSNMKWDAGFGIRAMAKGLVVRVDTAFSKEGFGVQMMVSQPFQF